MKRSLPKLRPTKTDLAVSRLDDSARPWHRSVSNPPRGCASVRIASHRIAFGGVANSQGRFKRGPLRA